GKILKNPQGMIRRNRKRLVRYGLVFGNLVIVAVALVLVVRSSGGNAAKYSALSTVEEARRSNPLDTLTATDIAVNIARMTDLPEQISVVNLADDIKLELNRTTAEKDVVLKPQ